MNKLYELIRKVAPTELSVMIEGESGTGKELIAESIHAESKRSDGPFVVLNCGAVPENLIDSELFGHERGSFTGATRRHDGVFHRADGGTLFLDEVTEMPIELQSRLLRVLETGLVQRVGGSSESKVDVRIVAATNRSVAASLTNGQLREDLCYRLSAFPIKVPPLRQRGPDVAFLADHFLTTLCEREQKHKIFHPSVTAVFEAYHWPGNVRQLKNEVEYAYVLADDEIRIDHLSQRFSDCQEVVNKDPGVVELRVGASIEQAERKLIEATLRRVHGDKRAAAEVLGISLRTLYNRVREYGNKAEEQQA
jgi:DNA-binding NtrC family response regulator